MRLTRVHDPHEIRVTRALNRIPITTPPTVLSTTIRNILFVFMTSPTHLYCYTYTYNVRSFFLSFRRFSLPVKFYVISERLYGNAPPLAMKSYRPECAGYDTAVLVRNNYCCLWAVRLSPKGDSLPREG